MRKWWRNLLRRIALEAIEDEEMRLINFIGGSVPSKKDPPAVKMEYWKGVLTALETPETKLVMYRIQIMYNRIQLQQLSLNPRDEKAAGLLQAKQQAIYEVLQLSRVASKRFLQYMEEVKNPQNADTTYKEEMPLGQTPND